MIKYIAILCFTFLLGFSFNTIKAEKNTVLSSVIYKSEFLLIGNLTTQLMDQIQLPENDNEQILGNSIKELFIIILVIISIIIMMLTPLILFYFLLIEFFNFQNCFRTMQNGAYHGNDDKSNEKIPTPTKNINNSCLQFYSCFIGNGTGLLCWIILSLWYIVFGFQDVSSGLKEYFYFPFKVFNTLINKEFMSSFEDMYENWVYMILIVIITFLFFLIGKSIGKLLGREKMNKMELRYQNKN